MLEISKNHGQQVVHISGPLDCVTVSSYKGQIHHLLNTVTDHVILDMAKVSFVDPSGIGLISTLFRGLRTRGLKLSVGPISGQPFEFLKQLKLLETLGITLEQPARDISVVARDDCFENEAA